MVVGFSKTGSRATSGDESSFVCMRGRALELSWLRIAFDL